MSSVIAICNMALANIGKGTINDLNEASTEAAQCKLFYASVRDMALQAFDWSWARKVQSMAELANVWEQRFQFAYRRPSDCLKPLRIIPDIDVACDIDPIEYAIRDTTIFCSVSPANLEYIARIEDPTKYPPLFQEALSWALAAKIAIPLTKDQSIRKDAYQIAAQTMDAAKTADANEEPTFWGERSELIASRGDWPFDDLRR